MSKHILHNHNDGIDRRGFLQCMAWAGTGIVWTIEAGIPGSRAFGQKSPSNQEQAGLTFVQISDSHIGFDKAANPDVAGTLGAAIDKINALDRRPEFILHTGDLTHGAHPAEFDTLAQLLQGAKRDVFYVPGEHDTSDGGKAYLERYGKNAKGLGWYSFDQDGVHFVGLSNVIAIESLGKLGPDQLGWLKDDLAGRSASMPIVVFAHIPLWSVYPQWGWGTDDGAEALSYMKRFGSVTVLNGHIHQTMQKVEGNVTFHTAMSTAFPQPAPGSAPSPGPMKVPADRLRSVLGIANVSFQSGNQPLAVVDSTLT
jgi:3',5'-cyclic AMP phosphodiesterase CpdA